MQIGSNLMAKFIKKLSIVEAEQYIPGIPLTGIELTSGGSPIFMEWDGPIPVRPTDWIVTYSDGRQQLYSDTTFRQFYEPIQD